MSCLRDSISQIDPSFQELIEAIENASSLTLLVLSGWRLARMLAIKLVVEVLTERAQRPTQWPDCPKCGKRLHSKGFAPRQIHQPHRQPSAERLNHHRHWQYHNSN